MLHKTSVLNIVFFALSFICFSQTQLKGIVSDSLQNPISYANIVAKPIDSIKDLKFAISDEKGRFQLELEAIPYSITVSHLGYESVSLQVFPDRIFTNTIVLKHQTETLDEVMIIPPVIVKEDTIIYDIDKLITGKEHKLKDILKKLPGIEVNKDGSVLIQGKKVTTLLVENRKFFGGGTKLGIDNIPADAVDLVEVLENYNEVPFLKGFRKSDEIAMNIKLKQDRKNFVFGDIEGGKGNQDYYRAHSNLFYYSPKTSVNTIGNINNTREQVLTYQQNFEFHNGMNPVFKEGKTILASPDELSQFTEGEDVLRSEREFGAVNISQEVSDKLNISGYGIFSSTSDETLIESFNQYNTFSETRAISSNVNNELGIGNFNVMFLPNLRDRLYFKTQFKKTNDLLSNTIRSVVDTIDNTFLTRRDIKGNSFSQTFEWHRNSSIAHSFSGAINYTFEEGAPEGYWETPDRILEGIIPVSEDSVYRIRQSKIISNHQFNFILKHYWVLNKNNHIYSTFGNTYLYQKFETSSDQELSNGTIISFHDSEFGNDLDFRLNDAFYGLHYKLKLGIFSFDQGVFVHHYNWYANQQNSVKRAKTLWLPSFSAEVKFDRSRELEFNYELRSSFSDASHFANKLYIQSYNAVERGNETLENELSHNFRMRFTKFSVYRGVRLYILANYTKQVRGIVDAVSYLGTNQSVAPILMINPLTSWSIYGSIRKKIKDINFSVGLRQINSEFLQQVNNDFVNNKSNSLSYDLSAITLIDELPTLEIGFKQSIGNYNLGGESSKFITNEPFFNIEYDFLKGFIASFDYTSFRYQNKTINLENNYEIANTRLSYNKEGRPWSFKIEVHNLFNAEFKRRNSFSSYIISDTRTYILPRIFMFNISYKL